MITLESVSAREANKSAGWTPGYISHARRRLGSGAYVLPEGEQSFPDHIETGFLCHAPQSENCSAGKRRQNNAQSNDTGKTIEDFKDHRPGICEKLSGEV